MIRDKDFVQRLKRQNHHTQHAPVVMILQVRQVLQPVLTEYEVSKVLKTRNNVALKKENTHLGKDNTGN